MKLSGIIIGLLFGIVIITTFMQGFSSINTEYGVTDYNSSELEPITAELDEIEDLANETKSNIEDVKSNPLIPDTLGVLVVGGIGGIKTALKSADSFVVITTESADLLPLGDLSGVLIVVIITSIIIIFFIGILAHYIRPSDRL